MLSIHKQLIPIIERQIYRALLSGRWSWPNVVYNCKSGRKPVRNPTHKTTKPERKMEGLIA